MEQNDRSQSDREAKTMGPTPAGRPAGIRRWLAHPSEVVALIAIAVILGALLWLPLGTALKQQTALLVAIMAIYFPFLVRWLSLRYETIPQVRVAAAMGGIVLLMCASVLLTPYGVHIDLFYILLIVAVAITVGTWPAISFALLTAGGDGLISFLQFGFSRTLLVSWLLRTIVYVSAAYVLGSITQRAQEREAQTSRRNTNLAFLLDTSATTLASLEMDKVLSSLAVKIATGLPATWCVICLLDQTRQRLVTHGVHALRSLSKWQPAIGQAWMLQELPRLRAAIDQAEVVLLESKDPTVVAERAVLFPDDIRVVCFVPIIAEGTTLGAVLVGEARVADRDPIDQEKLTALRAVAAQLGVVVQNARLHQATQRQADRFAALVEIGRAINSTLDLDDLMELIHQQLSLAIPSDTYYVALYEPTEGTFDVRILVDGNQHFPRERIPLGQGLATWVVLKRQPVLVRHMSAEMESLPCPPIVLGQQRMSESWLGVPIMTGDSILGLLATASYQPYVFDEDDMALLTTVAQQAALALDNARHHAEVEDQARHDSLTGVHNHGYLLVRLRDEVEKCANSGQPLSLIMLDIDHFKIYNDQYGHVIGDEVLRLTAQTMQASVTTRDVVGRWGGEEFAVVLPGATAAQAQTVAEGIRRGLANAQLTGAHGETIPKPTVSQGIASFPAHVSNANDLVILADRMLYVAKGAGRDSIKVA